MPRVKAKRKRGIEPKLGTVVAGREVISVCFGCSCDREWMWVKCEPSEELSYGSLGVASLFM